jgi:predicted HTH transcriptional regulator
MRYPAFPGLFFLLHRACDAEQPGGDEVICQALRKSLPMFPALASRELVANALIHQNFHLSGAEPMVELFATRMEITNQGAPSGTDRPFSR